MKLLNKYYIILNFVLLSFPCRWMHIYIAFKMHLMFNVPESFLGSGLQTTGNIWEEFSEEYARPQPFMGKV